MHAKHKPYGFVPMTEEQKKEKLFWVTPYYVGVKPVYHDFEQLCRNVGPGWDGILEMLCAKLLKLGWNGGYQQIKEKFGTLRFYWGNNIKDEILSRIADDCVSAAEWVTGQTCEECGDYGKLRRGGWIRSLCNLHAVLQGYAINKYEKEYLEDKGTLPEGVEVKIIGEDDDDYEG